jgi:aspartyl-tRNA(Asn)/glutamyl-tRNA(Gln) amidotransferase subunit B
MNYSTVIGLEVHTQLATQTKLFCSCPVEFGAPSNTHVCPVCLAMPGSLPVPNQQAVEYGIRLGLALNCEIDLSPMWTRKNYFYPDLPKGYQITQTGGLPFYDRPICRNGHIDIKLDDGTTKRIRINRIHLEEDAGKLIHDITPTESHFDANRCGTPLCEIVTEPDMRNAREAVLYLEKLKQIIEYTGVSDANMERGNLRCDANISLRKDENAPFGTRAEIKNLNSFSNIEKAIDSERMLQAMTLDSGKEVVQCTKRYDVNSNKTFVLRSKEDAHDYRYFPEPDMVRIAITEADIERHRLALPELPEARQKRYLEAYGFSEYDALVLTADKSISDWFDEAAIHAKSPKLVCNWLISDILREIKDQEKGIHDILIQPKQLAKMTDLIENNTISGKIGKTVFAEMWATGKDPEVIIKEKDLVQITDTSAIEAAVREVFDANPSQVAELKSGKEKVRGFFVGQIMKKTQGKANPTLVNEFIDKILTEA